MYQKYIKRIRDFLWLLCGLVILVPAFLVFVTLIKLDSRGPAFFQQKRVGIHKIYFNIFRFCTIWIDILKDMWTYMLTNPEQYITRIGAFLRKTSLDELPQIINILKGDISIVGVGV